MTRRAHEAHRHALERGARGREQQIRAGRAEPDNYDARLLHGYGTSVAAAGSEVVVVPSRDVAGVGAFGGVTW